MEQMQQGIDLLLSENFSRPMLLEVITDAAEDERVFKAYYQTVKASLMSAHPVRR